MALKVLPIWVYPYQTHSQLGVSCFVQNKKIFDLLRNCSPKCASFGVKTRFQVEGKGLVSLSLSFLDSSSTDDKIDESHISKFKGFTKEVDSLPKPLLTKDFVAPRNEEAKVQVAYQGSPGAYSETAALNAYPICKTVPCDQIESVFKDDADNITRFLIIAREPVIPRTEKPHKTSIVFTLEEGPEDLFKASSVFALRDINLLKIESRPQRNRPLRIVDNRSPIYFDYLLYVDFEASMADPRTQSAMSHLQKICTFLRVLGCYPVNTAL